MSVGGLEGAIWSLKEATREHRSRRVATFDETFGHSVPPGPVFDAWAAEFACQLGGRPLGVLARASGTGEATRVLHLFGHRVTGVDLLRP